MKRWLSTKSTVKADANHNAGTISHIWNRPFALQTGYFPPNMTIRQNNRLWAGSLFSKSCRAEWCVALRHAVSVIPQSVGSGSAGLSHKAARRMASVILSEPWPQPRFSLLLPYFYIWVCHFNRVDKNQNCAYTLNPTQMKFGTRKMLTFGGQRVILMLLHNLRVSFSQVYVGKNVCFRSSYFSDWKIWIV